ncbi:hypothetical protein BU23DRAFT_600825 [Bimuria novae-zelandiae CBS 107.79]|uniref:Lysine-specific metallo-endopeptidase domain-containing protein n=1 Tax=Bimuria novae-zelandiae CBS 107.79 TaxID=1447943 RepID=A0A6A5V341_9PLEO|nr:hypothetical protein BU23DRAFT_600825 [Bimuria novae-zelandiae CBS 107.79]
MQLKVLCLAFAPAVLSAIIPDSIRALQFAHSIDRPSDLQGINWFYAEAECDSRQRDTLFRGFKDVIQLAYTALPAPRGIGDNPIFKDFWGYGYHSGPLQNRFNTIFNNLGKAGRFPSYGNGGKGETNQLNVRCKDYLSRCKSRILAYVSGNNMVLCPDFWSFGFPHLKDRVKGKPTRALDRLITIEHILLHELMHVDNAGFLEHITDIRTTLVGESDSAEIPGGITAVVVYGVQRCKKLAKKKGEETPNLQTLMNADNYAWFSSAYYFSKAWDITVNEPESYIEGSVTGNPYAPPNRGFKYADNDFGEAEWTAGL